MISRQTTQNPALNIVIFLDYDTLDPEASFEVMLELSWVVIKRYKTA